jgi:hypothetical protein
MPRGGMRLDNNRKDDINKIELKGDCFNELEGT